jgi:hypothetical protein
MFPFRVKLLSILHGRILPSDKSMSVIRQRNAVVIDELDSRLVRDGVQLNPGVVPRVQNGGFELRSESIERVENGGWVYGGSSGASKNLGHV